MARFTRPITRLRQDMTEITREAVIEAGKQTSHERQCGALEFYPSSPTPRI